LQTFSPKFSRSKWTPSCWYTRRCMVLYQV